MERDNISDQVSAPAIAGSGPHVAVRTALPASAPTVSGTPTSNGTRDSAVTQPTPPTRAAPATLAAAPSSPAVTTKGKRSGVVNYSQCDIDEMFAIIEEIEPIGANDWAAVAKEFEEWAKENGRPIRDATSLKAKFDRFAAVKKPTGDPSCPPNVRRAKQLAREIMSKTCSAVAGQDDEEDDIIDVEEYEEGEASGTKRKRPQIGVSPNKRRPGARGIKADDDKDDLIDVVSDIAKSIGSLVSQKSTEREPENLKEVVKETVKTEMASVQSSIDELKALVVRSFGGLPQE